jgi:hypothetical protein
MNPASTQLPDKTCITLIELSDHSKEITADKLEALAVELNNGSEFGEAVFRRSALQFAILSAGADEATVARAVSRRLRTSSSLRFVIVAAPKHGNTLQQLLDAADELLRIKKASAPLQKDSIH